MKFKTDFFRISLILVAAAAVMTMAPAIPSASAASDYKIPNATDTGLADENSAMLKKISKGVAAVSQKASEAIVFVSVYKTVKGMPFGMVDPFDFFFGPNGPGGQRQPDERRGPPGRQTPQKREGGLGSGFFIDLERGYIMTNNHVIQDADEIQLKLANGETYEGKIVGRDRNTDVAVVQVKEKGFNRKGLSQLGFADSDKVGVGDFVLALGAPYGLEASLSFGIVSAVGRGTLDITKLGNFIQTDAAINPGNSGGPLVDVEGLVVGMNTAIYSRTGGYNGIGFAVPSNFAKSVAETLINEGKVSRGYVGVGLQPIDPELHKSLNLPKDTAGSLVARVVKGGPAEKAGLEPGDVITAINGKPVRNDSEVINAIGLMRPGTQTELTVLRNGKARTTKISVERWPNEPDQLAGADERDGAGNPAGKLGPLGMSVAKLSPLMKEKYRIESDTGLVITDVKPDSSAARAGIQPGDLILQANGKQVRDPEALSQVIKSGGVRTLLRIERSGQFFFVPLRNE